MAILEAVLDGVVIRSYGLFHDVQTTKGLFRCTVRGRLKLDRRTSGGVVVGDRVRLLPIDVGEGVIEEIQARGPSLTRRNVLKGQPDQIILANPSQLVAVFSVAQPEPRLRMLDRFLVQAEAHELDAIICINKIDLDPDGSLREPFEIYERIGYRVLLTSSRTGAGIAEFRAVLENNISVLAGPSGVGKTSLINRISDSTLAIGEISEATGKGRHTTRGARLIPIAGGFLADTAGIRALQLAGVDREELALFFREFGPFLGKCRFHNCAHEGETGCAIGAAAERGAIDPRRMESYRQLRSRFDED